MISIDSVGSKVKELRSGKKMTLKELGDKTGLSIGFLSQFERGLTTIAIDSLQKISEILDVELSYFFDIPKKNDSIVMRSFEQKVSQILNIEHVYRILTNNIEDKLALPRLIEILPRAKNKKPEKSSERFMHKGEEFIYILEGILILIAGDTSYVMYPGDSAYYNSTTPHDWNNDTNKTVKFLCINLPNDLSNKDLNHN